MISWHGNIFRFTGPLWGNVHDLEMVLALEPPLPHLESTCHDIKMLSALLAIREGIHWSSTVNFPHRKANTVELWCLPCCLPWISCSANSHVAVYFRCHGTRSHFRDKTVCWLPHFIMGLIILVRRQLYIIVPCYQCHVIASHLKIRGAFQKRLWFLKSNSSYTFTYRKIHLSM